MKRRYFILLLFLIMVIFSQAQFTIYNIQLSQPSNASQLVDKLVGTGVTFSNATFTGSYGGTEAGNAGYFNGGTNIIGLNSGIILSTGNVGRNWYTGTLIAGPNLYYNMGTATGTGADATLQAIVGAQTYDRAVLEFEFVPESNFIQFRYVFASEEYNEWVNDVYNDVFGFFVTSLESDGYNYNNKNIAIVPNTTNTAVAINTINNGPCSGAPSCNTAGIGPCTNCAYYFDNATGARQIEYDGFTTVLTASCAVTPCKRYRMKIAIADVSDQWLDSGVFLEENSFVSPIIDNIGYTTSNPTAGGGTNMVEGCSNGVITFQLSSPTPMNRNVNFTIGGTAVYGTDYTTIPNISGTFTPPNNYYVTIPAGQSSTTLTIVPIQDGVVEGTESIIFGITTNLCPPYNTVTQTKYIIDNSTPFSASLPPEINICAGSSTQINATLNGGQPPFTYQWSSGHSTNPINVNPGATTIYNLTITDACGQTTTATTTVVVNQIPAAIPSVNAQAICSGQSTSINLNSNVPSANFAWTATGGSNISGYSNGSGNGIYQTLINSGTTAQSVTYTITASANGCTGSPANVIVTVNPTPIINNISTTPVTTCTGQPDGTITINASGGTAPLSYSLNGSAFQSSNSFSGVGAGNHNVVVQDAAGCQASQSNISVTTSSGPTINQIITTNLNCYGQNNGSITINATGAVEYSIDNGQTWSTSNIFTGLPAGTYPILVRDAGMCVAPGVAYITSPSEMTATFSTVDEFCGNIGSAVINVSGGVAPYTYLWSNNSTSNMINAYAGSYSVTVTDANNCTKVFGVNIGNIPAPVITNVNVTNVSCFNGNNGMIVIQATGAQFYSIDNGNTWSSSSMFNNLPAGTYTVIVRDANSCTDVETVIITSPTEITANITTTPELCGSPGSASINVSGGIAPYTFIWSNGSTSSNLTNVQGGTYTVTVTDANQCSKVFTANVPFQGGNAEITPTVTNVSCYGLSNGSI
ncbi:MAG: choice-of-anchor L domain-containing protein, partial [Bacteroidales bacterium]|nr:choice-of-anchor L domain-containing protein [Bacteroidales bacterium]